MASLKKLEQENSRLKMTRLKAAARAKLQDKSVVREAAGAVGGSLGAALTAVADSKVNGGAAPGDMATIGDTRIPIAPTVGAVLVVGAILIAKRMPATASFVGRAGMAPVDIALYQGVRNLLGT